MDKSARKHLIEVREGSDASTHSSDSQRRSFRNHFTPWLFDLLSLLFGVACLTAIIALLSHYDNKPLPNWHDVTYNAILSILAQAVKAALAGPLAETIGQLKWHWFWDPSRPRAVTDFDTYDAASRGPRGAFGMLFKRRMWSISSLGALLTIVAVGTEPFLQQIPAYPTRFRVSKEIAKMNTSTFYADYTDQLHGEGSELAPTTFELAPTTKGAFFGGLYNSNSGPPVVPACATGNCSWSPYTSLGVCSACASIAHLLNGTEIVGFDDYQMQWTAPNGFTGYSSWDLFDLQTDLSSILFKQLEEYSIVDLFYMQFLYQAADLDMSTPTAVECMLYFCVRTYSATVQNGNLEEKVISTFPNISTSASVASSALHSPTRQDNCTARGEGVSSNSTNGCVSNPSVTSLHPKGPVYDPGMDPYMDGKVDLANPATYNGNVTISPPGDDSTYKINVPTLILAREWMQSKLKANIPRNVEGQAASDIAQIFLNADPSPIIQRIAHILTGQIRNTGGEHASGQTLVAETYVQVRWGWLILPIAVLVLTILFLVTTMVIGMIKERPTWKTSSLPTLLYSLEQYTANDIAAHGLRLNSLEREAERYSMAMSTQCEVWRLEGVKRTTYESR